MEFPTEDHGTVSMRLPSIGVTETARKMVSARLRPARRLSFSETSLELEPSALETQVSHSLLNEFLIPSGVGSETRKKVRERLSPPPHLKLEVQLQRQLDLARIARSSRIGPQNRRDRVGDLSKRTWGGNVRIRVCEVGVIEGIEELSSELQLPSFRELEFFEEAQVPYLDAWTVKLSRSACPEGSFSISRLRKRRRID